MSLEHPTFPLFGVQFHPESIASEYGMRPFGLAYDAVRAGDKLIANFFAEAAAWRQRRCGRYKRPAGLSIMCPTPLDASTADAPTPGFRMPGAWDNVGGYTNNGTSAALPRLERVTQVALDIAAGSRVDKRGLLQRFAAVLFEHLYGGEPYAVWLDSGSDRPTVRCTYMGDLSSSLAEVVECWSSGTVTCRVSNNRDRREYKENFFAFFKMRLAQAASLVVHTRQMTHPHPDSGPEFHGGYVGFFGYECLYDSLRMQMQEDGIAEDADLGHLVGNSVSYQLDPGVPLACWGFIDRLVAFDLQAGTVSVSCFIPCASPATLCPGPKSVATGDPSFFLGIPVRYLQDCPNPLV